jgi:tryptophan-rich sensory protein
MILSLLFAAAVFFAAWPHAMRESGVSASVALMMYGAASFLGGGVWVAAARTWPELHGRALQLGIVAGCLNALGCLFFAYVFTRQNRAELGRDIMISLVIQVGLNAAWAAYQSGGMNWRLAVGSMTAVLTILLLG